ncbi:hypothetical protein [Phosphitispora fastidiosa]|uniref:hypothetical protein n=1 Tax=Phosphitispora fastidiosa TaxID=2837202 RepID=UPI001E469651|nr:hypothetical protein [Phosphitispora fastidiosa]MBU7008388.1 hypothetical protein [Phosphitispora fastidiosa]
MTRLNSEMIADIPDTLPEYCVPDTFPRHTSYNTSEAKTPVQRRAGLVAMRPQGNWRYPVASLFWDKVYANRRIILCVELPAG